MSASNAPEGSAPNRRVAPANWLIVNVLPGILISFGLLVVLIAGAELYLRTTRPFFASHWPLRFDARYGWTFTPGGTVRLTNHLDFWTESKANSLGFLDREPVAAPSACRVAFIGDSFVEAAQVPIEQKMQVVFEKIATNVATAAFGFSGTGQASQLGFYDVFVRDFQPKVVVLVFFSSDFANNSATLEAIRSGWHPAHAPRVAVARNARGEPELVPADPDWQRHLAPAPQKNGFANAHTALLARSYLYAALHVRLSRIMPQDGDMDRVLYSKRYPKPLEDAVEFTGFALDQYVERSRRDNFRLVILVPSATWFIPPGSIPADELDASRVMHNLLSLAEPRGIPVIDQRAYIQSVGGDLMKALFRHDGHWSPQGHQWAAEALADFFKRSPGLCD